MHARPATLAAVALTAAGLLIPQGAAAQRTDLEGNGARPEYRIKAARAVEPVRIDGRLDDTAWQAAAVISGFVQNEPRHGEPATQDTHVRFAFDDEFLYVGAFLYDNAGGRELRVPDLRRDFDAEQHDVFTLVLDPFRDSRNVFVLQVNPAGAQRDAQVRDGINTNVEWDGVWHVHTAVGDSGWSVEMAIPWKSLRYPAGDLRGWSVNTARTLRRTGETSGWSMWPRAYSPFHAEYAGLLEGLEPPSLARNVRVQPYVLGRDERIGDDVVTAGSDRLKLGGELKWAITPNTVLDVTANTDFAQTDADEQVVNLNRYSVFFPEKRSFFLESATTFAVGYNLFTPFYSRRIGLVDGVPIPLDAGLRVTTAGTRGQAGALLVRQRAADGTPTTHFGVARGSLNLGQRSRVGALVVGRHDDASTSAGRRDNVVAAIDGYSRIGTTGAITAFVSASRNGGAASGTGFASYLWIRGTSSRGYLGFLQDIASRDYDAAAGFIFRTDVILNSPAGWFDWRPDWRPSFVRRMTPGFSNYTYHRLSDGAFLQADLRFDPIDVDMHDGSNVRVALGPTWHELDEAEAETFRPLGVRLAAGSYRYGVLNVSYESDASRRFGGSASVTTGGYFDGRLTTSRAALFLAPSPRLSARVTFERNDARGLGSERSDVSSDLVVSEVRIARDSRLHVSAFHQYNSLEDVSSWNARLSWEFRPLSYVHLVYNDNRYTADPRAPGSNAPNTRQLVLKLSWLGQV